MGDTLVNAEGYEVDRDEDEEYDPKKHQAIDLDRAHSRFTRFNSRYFDEDLEFNDVVNILVPPIPESSNIIQFELVLLKSSSIPKDYVVGWGVFPLVNSEFQINEGRFKCPLISGSVDSKIDKFNKIE